MQELWHQYEIQLQYLCMQYEEFRIFQTVNAIQVVKLSDDLPHN